MPGTESSPIYGLLIWAGAQAQPWVVENGVARAFEALHRASVADRDLTAPPGACDDGAAYLVGAAATGLWATHDGEMAVAVGVNAANGWIFLPVATEGALLWVDDEGIRIEYDGVAWNLFTGGSVQHSITIALSDLTSDLTTGADKGYWDPPYPITILGVSAAVFNAPTGAAVEIDINEAGVSILSTVISIDDGEVRSADSATPPVISDSTVSGRLTFDIDQVGSTNAGKGAQVTIEYAEL